MSRIVALVSMRHTVLVLAAMIVLAQVLVSGVAPKTADASPKVVTKTFSSNQQINSAYGFGLLGAWGKAWGWVKENIVKPVVDVAVGTWEGVKEEFKKRWVAYLVGVIIAAFGGGEPTDQPGPGQPHPDDPLPPQPLKVDGTAEQPNADGATEQPNADGATEQPNADGVTEQPNADGATEQPNADGAAEQPNADGAAEQPNADGATEQPNADGAAEQPNAAEEQYQSQ